MEKDARGCTVPQDDQEYEVDCLNGKVTFIPRGIEARKQQIYQMYMHEVKMNRYPKELATLKKIAIKELLESL